MSLTPIPDPLIESYWTTTLSDLSRARLTASGRRRRPPPNNFDQGVALIESGTTYLNTSIAAVQRL